LSSLSIEGSAETFKCVDTCTKEGYVTVDIGNGSTCGCKKGFYLNQNGKCEQCPDGFYCAKGLNVQPKLCEPGTHCIGGTKLICYGGCPEPGTIRATLPDQGSPFYTSVCHQYASGGIKTMELDRSPKSASLPSKVGSNRNGWQTLVSKACKDNAKQVSTCSINEFRDKGTCKACLPGYICPSKCILAAWLGFGGIH
jgi:hypothetical protein